MQAQAQAVYIDPEAGIGTLPLMPFVVEIDEQHDVIALCVCVCRLSVGNMMSRPTTAEGR